MRYLILIMIVIVTSCAGPPSTTAIVQAIGVCPSSPPARCQANLYSSDGWCTEQCQAQMDGDVEAYCPEITESEDVGCRLLCAGTPNVSPTYEWSACMNLCYSKIFHNCVGGRIP